VFAKRKLLISPKQSNGAYNYSDYARRQAELIRYFRYHGNFRCLVTNIEHSGKCDRAADQVAQPSSVTLCQEAYRRWRSKYRTVCRL